MNHPEVMIARQAIEEGRGLVVIVNKMDLLRDNQKLFDKVMDAVPTEIQTVIPQVTVFLLLKVRNALVFNLE
jgi:predicted GTPase